MWSYLNKTCVFKYCRLYELIMNRSHPKTCKTRLQFHLKGERERMDGRKETITRGAACARAVVSNGLQVFIYVLADCCLHVKISQNINSNHSVDYFILCLSLESSKVPYKRKNYNPPHNTNTS